MLSTDRKLSTGRKLSTERKVISEFFRRLDKSGTPYTALKIPVPWLLGFPDYILLFYDAVWFVEFKSPVGKLSHAQMRWQDKLCNWNLNYALMRDEKSIEHWVHFFTRQHGSFK